MGFFRVLQLVADISVAHSSTFGSVFGSQAFHVSQSSHVMFGKVRTRSGGAGRVWIQRLMVLDGSRNIKQSELREKRVKRNSNNPILQQQWSCWRLKWVGFNICGSVITLHALMAAQHFSAQGGAPRVRGPAYGLSIFTWLEDLLSVAALWVNLPGMGKALIGWMAVVTVK